MTKSRSLRQASSAEPRAPFDDFKGASQPLASFEGFDESMQPLLRRLNVIYVHVSHKDNLGKTLSSAMSAALDDILESSPPKPSAARPKRASQAQMQALADGDVQVEGEHFHLIGHALWLKVFTALKNPHEGTAQDLLDYFEARAEAGKLTPALKELSPLPGHELLEARGRMPSFVSEWPLTWVEPRQRAGLMQQLLETNHPLAAQALEVPARQLNYIASIRAPFSPDRHAAFEEVHDVIRQYPGHEDQAPLRRECATALKHIDWAFQRFKGANLNWLQHKFN